MHPPHHSNPADSNPPLSAPHAPTISDDEADSPHVISQAWRADEVANTLLDANQVSD